MFTIGDLARHGRVSVRMPRHDDAVELLRPAHVDPSSSYRYDQANQLARLNRVIALKDLGFTLDQVRAILDEDVSTEELRGMLRLRRAELEPAGRRGGGTNGPRRGEAPDDRKRGRHASRRRCRHLPSSDLGGRVDRHRGELRTTGHRTGRRPTLRRAVPPT